MPGFTASYDQMTAVFNGRRLKFAFDSRGDCAGCALYSRRSGCEIHATDCLAQPLCGGSRKDGRNGRWKKATYDRFF